VCIELCTIVAHNIAQNRPDSFPPYPPDNHHCSDDVYLREEGGHYLLCGANRSCFSETVYIVSAAVLYPVYTIQPAVQPVK